MNQNYEIPQDNSSLNKNFAKTQDFSTGGFRRSVEPNLRSSIVQKYGDSTRNTRTPKHIDLGRDSSPQYTGNDSENGHSLSQKYRLKDSLRSKLENRVSYSKKLRSSRMNHSNFSNADMSGTHSKSGLNLHESYTPNRRLEKGRYP